jgi:hypothetical protein
MKAALCSFKTRHVARTSVNAVDLEVWAAGGLAHAYGIKDNPLLAINIGASAPLILQALSKGVR